MKYHVKWLYVKDGMVVVGKEVVEEDILGHFITGLNNDAAIVIQVEPI